MASLALPRTGFVTAGRLFTLLAGPGIVGLIAMAIASVTPKIAAEMGAGADAALFAQLVMTLPAVMVILGAPFGGWLADRTGHRQVLIAALSLYTVAGAAGLVLSDFTLLIVSRLLLGLAGGVIQPVCLALIGRYFEGAERERVLGFVVTTSSVMAIGGLILGGLLADAFGWHAAFALYLIGAVVLATAFTCIPRTPVARTTQVQGSASTALLRLWPYYALVTMLTAGMFLPAIQAPFLLEARGIISAAQASLPASACAAVATLSSASYWLMRRILSMRAIAAMTAACMGAGAMLAAYGIGLLPIVIGCALIGIGAGLVEPNTGAAILRRTPQSLHARAMGLLIAALYGGQFLNPLLFAPLRQLFGVSGAFMAAGVCLVGVALVIAARRAAGKRPLESPT